MGTRSLTHVYDGDDLLCTIYRQFDGYPTGMGADIKKTLGGRKFVNGYTESSQINGMGCAAARLIAALKEDAGGIYITRPGTEGVWEDYTYELRGSIEDLDAGISLTVIGSGQLYNGPLDNFDPEACEAAED